MTDTNDFLERAERNYIDAQHPIIPGLDAYHQHHREMMQANRKALPDLEAAYENGLTEFYDSGHFSGASNDFIDRYYAREFIAKNKDQAGILRLSRHPVIERAMGLNPEWPLLPLPPFPGKRDDSLA